MLWPAHRRAAPPPVSLAPGLKLRTYRPGDEEGWYAVMELAGFGQWDRERFLPYFRRILPEGLFFVEDTANGRLIATAQALHGQSDQHPFGGELGWVAGDPAYRGRGVGLAVCAAVTQRFLEAHYTRIYLHTDDYRLPALKIYLKLGYEPYLFEPDMPERWRAVCSQLDWPFAPGEWSGMEEIG
jgi:mycothiol synthase